MFKEIFFFVFSQSQSAPELEVSFKKWRGFPETTRNHMRKHIWITWETHRKWFYFGNPKVVSTISDWNERNTGKWQIILSIFCPKAEPVLNNWNILARVGNQLIYKRKTNKEGWLEWYHDGLRTQRYEFEPRLGQISMKIFSKLTGAILTSIKPGLMEQHEFVAVYLGRI